MARLDDDAPSLWAAVGNGRRTKETKGDLSHRTNYTCLRERSGAAEFPVNSLRYDEIFKFWAASNDLEGRSEKPPVYSLLLRENLFLKLTSLLADGKSKDGTKVEFRSPIGLRDLTARSRRFELLQSGDRVIGETESKRRFRFQIST